MIRLSLIGLIALTGCVMSSEVVPVGPDSFMVNTTVRGGGGAGGIEAVKVANRYCDSSNLHMIVRRVDSTGVPGWTPVSSNLIFSCVSDSDPEYRRPNLKREPNVRIENR